MVKLTEDIKNDLKKVRLVPLATSSPAGEPNVAAMGVFVLQDDDETFWFVDNFMQKTLKNLKENPKAAFYIWSPDTAGAYQIKCAVTDIINDGPMLAKAKAMAEAFRPGLPTKGLVIMKVLEVYSIAPGPTAGKKLL